MVEDVAQINAIVNFAEIPEQILFAEVKAGYGLIDSGATRTVIGEETWQAWLKLLGKKGANVEAKKVFRDFRFGDGATLRSSVDVTFPVKVAGRDVELTASIIPGHTPLLVARPVLERWKMVQDFAAGKIKMMDQEEWTVPLRTANGHYLIELLPAGCEQVLYEGVPDDSYTDTPMILEPGEYPDDMPRETEFEDMSIDQAELEAALQSAYDAVHFAQESRPKIFWELFVDAGNLSQEIARHLGTQVSTFSLPEWDFDKSEIQEGFITLMRKIGPSHLWMAASCTKWSPMQAIDQRTEEQAQKLLEERKRLVKGQVNFAMQVFMLAVEIGTEVTIEHPDASVMWQTSPMKRLRSYYDVKVDRCHTGLVQNYEEGFVALASEAILDDMQKAWARRQAMEIMTLEDLPEKVPDSQYAAESLNKDLVRKVGRSSLMTVAKLHRQLGHPGRDRLVQAVRGYGLGHNAVKAAHGFKCAVCEAHSVSKLARPAAVHKAGAFNDMVYVDGFVIKWKNVKYTVLAIMDAFSRFEQMGLLKDEHPETEIEVLEKYWLRWAGAPNTIKTDASGSHMSEKFVSWTDLKGIRLIIIPKEAHYRLGVIERARAVRRDHIMKMLSENDQLSVDQVAQLVVEQRNRLRTVNGSAPAAVVFGRLPQQPGNADEPFCPAAADIKDQDALQRLRTLAAVTFHQTNSDRSLRAAMLAKMRPNLEDFVVGTYVYYFRSQAPDGKGGKFSPPGRWRGIEEPVGEGSGSTVY